MMRGCKNKGTGQLAEGTGIKIRAACKPNEVPVDPVALNRKRSQGDQGSPRPVASPEIRAGGLKCGVPHESVIFPRPMLIVLIPAPAQEPAIAPASWLRIGRLIDSRRRHRP
jgi:hypothetical protein